MLVGQLVWDVSPEQVVLAFGNRVTKLRSRKLHKFKAPKLSSLKLDKLCTMIAEYERQLIPKDIIQRSLDEFTALLTNKNSHA